MSRDPTSRDVEHPPCVREFQHAVNDFYLFKYITERNISIHHIKELMRNMRKFAPVRSWMLSRWPFRLAAAPRESKKAPRGDVRPDLHRPHSAASWNSTEPPSNIRLFSLNPHLGGG